MSSLSESPRTSGGGCGEESFDGARLDQADGPVLSDQIIGLDFPLRCEFFRAEKEHLVPEIFRPLRE